METTKKRDRKEYFAEYHKNNTQVRITFNNSDYAVIEKIATKQGLTIASFIRYATLAQAKNLYLFPSEIEKDIERAIRNMRSIGTNINQIARYANKEKYASSDSLESVFNFLLKLEKEIFNLKQIIDKK